MSRYGRWPRLLASRRNPRASDDRTGPTRAAVRSKTFARVLPLALAAFLPASARADLPLTVEDLLTAQNRLRLELSLTYANADKTGVQTGAPLLIQTGPAQFVAVPTQVGESRSNRDTLVLATGLRYGLSADTELYGRASWLSNSLRTEDANGARSESDSRFADAWLGVNHRFIREGESPALLGFAEAAVAERESSGTVHGRAWLLGFTTYRVIDPVVLSLTGAYRINLRRAGDGERRDPGDLLLLNPSVAFAVNNEVTLSGGLTWRRQQAERVESQRRGIATTRTDLNLGLGYAFSERSTLSFTTRANLSGAEGAEFGLTWLYKLGELPRRERAGAQPK